MILQHGVESRVPTTWRRFDALPAASFEYEIAVPELPDDAAGDGEGIEEDAADAAARRKAEAVARAEAEMRLRSQARLATRSPSSCAVVAAEPCQPCRSIIASFAMNAFTATRRLATIQVEFEL